MKIEVGLEVGTEPGGVRNPALSSSGRTLQSSPKTRTSSYRCIGEGSSSIGDLFFLRVFVSELTQLLLVHFMIYQDELSWKSVPTMQPTDLKFKLFSQKS